MATLGGGAKLHATLKGIADKLADGKRLRVGFLEKQAKYPDGTNVAQVAFWDEYGTKTAPPRPFFRNTVATKSSKWGKALGMALKADDYDAERALSTVGEGIKDQITQSIVEFQSPANAASTVKKKGFDKPLVDKGDMQRSVDFDIQGDA